MPRRQTPSFSLIEMMVAIAILSIIAVVLLSMVTSMTMTWQLGQAKSERRTMGRAVLERMSRDLRLATLPASRSSLNSLQFIINPPGLTAATYEFPQAIFWQAPIATDGGANGNLAVVGYFIQWIDKTPTLCRVLINPSTAPSTSSSTNYYAIYSAPTAWITNNTLANTAPATKPSYAGLLAENVLGLWVQALDPQGVPIKQTGKLAGEDFDSRLPYTYASTVYPSALTTNLPSVLPAAVQIAILVIDSRTAKRLTGVDAREKPPALSGDFWGDIQNFYTHLPAAIQKGAEIQTTTVNIPSGPR